MDSYLGKEEEIRTSWRGETQLETNPYSDPSVFLSQNDSFLFGATKPKPAAKAETILCPPNRFGCLYSNEEQNVLAGPTGPPAVSDSQVTPGHSEPLDEPQEPILSPELNNSLNSVGHTPFPPRRLSSLKRGGLCRQSEPRNNLALNTSSGSTRAQVVVPQSPLGPIAPPSFNVVSNKSLFDQMRAVVPQNHARTVVKPIGPTDPINTINFSSDCAKTKEKD
ncbi:hypothetical protein NE237_000008 [Protea cynaroides]|uniref:Uncharacterized protein n=1 Tax=Protea cynaroides TaxID=273540 RepID=A0A9Q0GL95_9MAGN|nr:hypothetical protein NE237_000008 [Protea cynaroides]